VTARTLRQPGGVLRGIGLQARDVAAQIAPSRPMRGALAARDNEAAVRDA
jgi:hypothetical protein